LCSMILKIAGAVVFALCASILQSAPIAAWHAQ